MKRLLSSVVIIGLLLFAFFIMTAHPFQAANSPRAIAGQLNLDDWSFAQQGTVKLGGEWEVYEGQLLSPEHFRTGEHLSAAEPLPQLSGYFDPATNRSLQEEKDSDGIGPRTYRLKILLDELPEQALAMKLNNISGSSVLFVNGRMVGGHGTVALDEQQYKAEANGYDAYFGTDSRELEVILQVTNYAHYSYSFQYNMWLGLANDIARQTANGIAIELCGSALCFIIFLYHLYIAVYTKSKRYLYFALLFCALALLFLITGEMNIMQFIKHIPYELHIKLRGLFRLSTAMLFQLYLVNEIRGLLSTKVHRFMIAVYAVITILILVLDSESYSRVIDYIYLYLMFAVIYKFWRLLRVWHTQRLQFSVNSAFVHVIIVLCWMTSYLNNTLYNLGFSSNKAVGSIAISLFILLSQLLLAFRYIRNVSRVKGLEQAKEEFFVNSAYYMQAPLDSMISITSQMVDRERQAGRQKRKPEFYRQAEMVNQLVLRMIRHVNDIKDLTLLKHDQLKLSFDSISLRTALERAVGAITIFRGEQPITAHLNAAEHIMVLGDEERVRQVLYTLIRQAANRTGATSVQVSAHVEKNELVIHIQDDGAAMTKDKQARLFQPDYMDDTDIGFNLFMTRELVQAMGGKLSLAWSKQGEGTCMELRMAGYEAREQQRVDEQTLELRTEQLMPSWNELGHHKEQQRTILIVEDQYYNIQTLLAMLQSESFNLMYAYSGEEALHIMRSYRIDLVLMDIGLQGQSGISVCREIRTQYSLIELPIILMSVSMAAEELEQGFGAGANDYIRKPFLRGEIIARVKSQLAISASMELALQNELAFLQAQIEPHFIYNAINSVISLCYIEPMKAAQVLTEFSQYLRLVFDIEAVLNEAPLQRELDLIEVYVNIERARFGDKFKLVLDVPQQLRNVKVPSFCIQPLVENAIKHGLYNKQEGGTVTVAATYEDEIMTIVVSDDGVGMSEQQLQELLEEQGGGGVGFGNVQKRIRHLPGSSFKVTSEQGIGTTISISFTATEHCFQ